MERRRKGWTRTADQMYRTWCLFSIAGRVQHSQAGREPDGQPHGLPQHTDQFIQLTLSFYVILQEPIDRH